MAGEVLLLAPAVTVHIVRGILRDTGHNQMRKPHRLGSTTLPGGLIITYMWLPIAGEIGGILVLFAGFVRAAFA